MCQFEQLGLEFQPTVSPIAVREGAVGFRPSRAFAASVPGRALTAGNGVADQNMTNPLVNSRPSLEHIESTPSSRDGIPQELEELLQSYGTSLVQSCGILLKL